MINKNYISMSKGWFITITGHALFFIYLFFINYFSDDLVYSEFRYWFNAAAICSQLLIFATDIFLLKTVRFDNLQIKLPKHLISIWLGITCFCLICIVITAYQSKYTQTALVLMSWLWALSNILVAFYKIYSTPTAAFFHSNITLRVVRLISFLPLGLLFFTSLALINMENLIIITIISQLVFCFLMSLTIIKWLRNLNIIFIAYPTFLKSVVATFMTTAVGLLMLRVDVLLVYIFGVTQNYKFFDYAFIIIAICHTSSQILLRNAEAKVVNKEVVDRNIVLSDFLNYAYVSSGLVVVFMFVAKEWSFNQQGQHIISVILAGYLFYFSFGPLLELRNLKSSSLKPFGLFVIATAISYFVAVNLNLMPELRCAYSIAMSFVFFRILHCIVIEKITDYHVYFKRLPLIFLIGIIS